MQGYTAVVHCYILLLKGVHQFVLLHNNIFIMCPLEPQAPFPELHFLEYFELYLLTSACTKNILGILFTNSAVKLQYILLQMNHFE